ACGSWAAISRCRKLPTQITRPRRCSRTEPAVVDMGVHQVRINDIADSKDGCWCCIGQVARALVGREPGAFAGSNGHLQFQIEGICKVVNPDEDRNQQRKRYCEFDDLRPGAVTQQISRNTSPRSVTVEWHSILQPRLPARGNPP